MHTATSFVIFYICFPSSRDSLSSMEMLVNKLKFSLQIFITDYFFKATLDEGFRVADIEVIVLAMCAGLCTSAA